MKAPRDEGAGEPPVGLLLLSHGPLADALRETVHVLEPDTPETCGALSLAWDEAPEKASQRLREAISAADRGRGVVLLTDMFGGTPSNLALAFRERGKVEIVTGVNLPMVLKAIALCRVGEGPTEIACTLVERGRKSIVAAAELMETEQVRS